ncbi:MAG: hypothetical protein OQK51_16850 [Kangiellaceae bacterium]|nr:hypothetical protein [Kangiellaceae bacterium]
MKNRLTSLPIYLSLLVLSGCIDDYYGYTQQEWNNLSQEQQKKAIDKYNKLVAGKNKMVEGDKLKEVTEEFIDRNIGKH